MSPARFQHQRIIKDQTTIINGSRPSPLQVHGGSHLIHKSSSSSSSSISTTACSSSSSATGKHGCRINNGPVIIYTQSPKVIHTQPRDFMALVQKLTGLSSSVMKQGHKPVAALLARPVESSFSGAERDGAGAGVAQDLNLDYGSSEKIEKNDDDDDLIRGRNNNNFLSEMPLLTPTGMEMFKSRPSNHHHQQQQFRFPSDSIFSPATLEFIKTLPEC